MLTPRMKLIFDHVMGKTVADIGSDHAYIPIELVKSGKCEKVIATDIRIGPAETARRHAQKQQLCIEVRVGNGLSVLSAGETEDIIIAGMGGKLICSILENEPLIASKSTLILQPMNGQYELRKFLMQKNYTVADEDLALEGFKVYNLLIVRKCENPILYRTECDMHLPSTLRGHIYFEHLREKKLRELTRILCGLKNAKGTPDYNAIEYCERIIHEMKSV